MTTELLDQLRWATGWISNTKVVGLAVRQMVRVAKGEPISDSASGRSASLVANANRSSRRSVLKTVASSPERNERVFVGTAEAAARTLRLQDTITSATAGRGSAEPIAAIGGPFHEWRSRRSPGTLMR